MKILHIDSCIRKNSRTRILANYLLKKLDGEIEVVTLEKSNISPLNLQMLELRDQLIKRNDFSHPIFNYAKQFIETDIVVISAPLWDLSFPSALKVYFENINISGLVFKYSEHGIPISLCKAKKLYYITTSGGLNLLEDYGYGYIKALSSTFYGINDIKCIKAQGLDIYNTDTENILNNTKQEIDKLFE